MQEAVSDGSSSPPVSIERQQHHHHHHHTPSPPSPALSASWTTSSSSVTRASADSTASATPVQKSQNPPSPSPSTEAELRDADPPLKQLQQHFDLPDPEQPGHHDGHSNLRSRRGKRRRLLRATAQRRCCGSTGEHLDGVFAALETLQRQPADRIKASQVETASSVHPACSPSTRPAFTLRDGAAAWMCNRLELLWETATKAAGAVVDAESLPSSSQLQSEGIPKREEKSNGAEKEKLDAKKSEEIRFPSPVPPGGSALAAVPDRIGNSARQSADTHDIGSSCDSLSGGTHDGALQVALTRSRLVVRLLALEVLRQRHARRRRRRSHERKKADCERSKMTCDTAPPSRAVCQLDKIPNTSPPAATNTTTSPLLPSSPSSSRTVCGEEEAVAVSKSAVVQRWLWQRAAGLPRHEEGQLVLLAAAPPRLPSQRDSSTLHNDFASLFVEWLAVELADAESDAAAQSQEAGEKATCDTKLQDASPDNVAEKRERCIGGEAATPETLVVAEVMEKSGDNSQDGEDQIALISSNAMQPARAKEEKESALLRLNAPTPASCVKQEDANPYLCNEELDQVSVLKPQTSAQLAKNGAANKILEDEQQLPFSIVSPPARRILRLGVRPSAVVKTEALTTADGCARESGGGNKVAALPGPDQKEVLGFTDGLTARVEGGEGKSEVEYAKDDLVLRASFEQPPQSGENINRDATTTDSSSSQAAAASNSKRRLTIQLFRRPMPVAAPLLLDEEQTSDRDDEQSADAHDEAGPHPLKKEEEADADEEKKLLLLSPVETAAERLIDEAEMKRANGPSSSAAGEVTDAAAEVNARAEAEEAASKRVLELKAAATAQHARWRRLAPFILYAPRGSGTESELRTVLTALGFSASKGSTPTQRHHHHHHRDIDEDHFEKTCGGGSSSSSDGGATPQRTPPVLDASSHSNARASAPPTLPPLAPLGRLPPLLSAYAWVHEPAVRAAWLAHIIGDQRTEAAHALLPPLHAAKLSVRNCDGEGGAPCLSRATACEEAARAKEEGEVSLTAKARSAAAAMAGVSPLSFQSSLTELDSLPLPCVALADSRVAAALRDILSRSPSLIPSDLRAETVSPTSLTSSSCGCCCLPSSFESCLFAYLCYPLAGVPAPHLEAAAASAASAGIDVRSSTSPPITAAAWETYLAFRYGVTARRRKPTRVVGEEAAKAVLKDAYRQHRSKMPRGGVDAAVARGVLERKRQLERTLSWPSEANLASQEAYVSGRTPSLSRSVAATMASCYAARPSAVYVAVMELAAALFFVELRRTCDAANGPDALQSLQESAKRVLDERGEDADASKSRASIAALSLATPFTTSSSASSSPSSMQIVLERDIETDTSLCCYVQRNMRRFRPPTASEEKETAEEGGRRPSLPCLCDALTAARLPRDTDAAPNAQKDTANTASAAALWLGLVTVLSVGESGTAQYVRGALLAPTACASFSSSTPAATTTTTTTTTRTARRSVLTHEEEEDEGAGDSEAVSLAPFTMPTLFCNTLEDLYREEHHARGRPAPPLCTAPHNRHTSAAPSSATTSADRVGSESAETRERTKFVLPSLQPNPTALTHADVSVTVAAAVALRHPRVLLRQAHFLWCLSSCGVTSTDSAAYTKEDEAATSAPSTTTTTKVCCRNAAACRDEFGLRLGSVVESVQLAACAGLPAPLATSIFSRSAPFRCSAADRSITERSTEDCKSEKVVRDRTVGSAGDAANTNDEASARSSSTNNEIVSAKSSACATTAAALAQRPRLQLRLPSTSTTTAEVQRPGLVEASLATSRKRVRSNSSREVHHNGSSAHAALMKRRDDEGEDDDTRNGGDENGDDDGSATAPLPPLDSLADVQVRWRQDSLSASATPAPCVTLLALFGDVLWAVLRHLSTCLPLASPLHAAQRQPGPAPGSLPSIDNVQREVPLHSTSGNAAAGAAFSPARRTLMLRLDPAYATLQQFWLALRPFAPSGHSHVTPNSTRAASSDSTSRSNRSGSAKEESTLEVELPVMQNDGGLRNCDGRRMHADLRSYESLAASLRGVLGVAVGYGAYAVLHRVVELYRSGLATAEKEKQQKAAETESGGAAATAAAVSSCAHPSQALQEALAEGEDATRTQCQEEEEPACLADSVSLTSDTEQAALMRLNSLTWLTAQLRAFHEDVLRPLNRVFTVQTSTTSAPPIHNLGADASEKSSCRHPQPPAATVVAAWLSYKPLSHVLFPALAHYLDASLTSCAARHVRKCDEDGQLDEARRKVALTNPQNHNQRSVGKEHKEDQLPPRQVGQGPQRPLGSARDCVAPQSEKLERAEAEVHAAWLKVRRALQQAGVALTDAISS